MDYFLSTKEIIDDIKTKVLKQMDLVQKGKKLNIAAAEIGMMPHEMTAIYQAIINGEQK